MQQRGKYNQAQAVANCLKKAGYPGTDEINYLTKYSTKVDKRLAGQCSSVVNTTKLKQLRIVSRKLGRKAIFKSAVKILFSFRMLFTILNYCSILHHILI